MKLHANALAAVALLATASLAVAQNPAAPAETPSAARHVRVKEGGAKLRNLADPNAEIVLDAPAGTLMAVHGERAGWLEVEPACGMKVWIFGGYLGRTTTPGVAEVTANSVRMRPLPSSDEKSFPLPTKVESGERVRVIARADAKKPIGDDWVQVWSPPGARAWIAAADTKPLAAGEDARTAWASAIKGRETGATPVVDLFATGGTAAAAAKEAAAKPVEPKAQAANAKLTEAEKLLAAARAAEKPDFTAAKTAFQAVIAQSGEGAAAETARARLEEISIREEIQHLRADKQKYESERTGKLAEAEAKLREVAKRQDPLWGRFQARGWLDREQFAGTAPRYVLRWGGREVAEIACGNGRYNLDAFVGYEVGILGVTQRAAIAATDSTPSAPARVDATKIEVISARAGG